MFLNIRILLTICCLALMQISCDQEIDSFPDGDINFYLLESYEVTNPIGGQIDESKVVCQKIPLIKYEELLAYDPGNYIFHISAAAKTRIINTHDQLARQAFGVTAGNELIYTGYFWPGYLSSSCDWVVIDPLSIGQGNAMQVRLGYPGTIQGIVIPDNRNDRRLMEIFRRDNKLIE